MKRGKSKLTIVNNIKKEFLGNYKRNICNISTTCESVNINRLTYYNWRERDEEFNKSCEEAENSIIDMAEIQLVKNVAKGKETSLIFLLCNRRPDRWHNVNKVDMEIKGELKSKHELDLSKLSLEDLESMKTIINKAKKNELQKSP